MKRLIMAVIIMTAIVPARAQFFKKLKEEASQKMKEKLEMKKNQKIDEQTEKASTKVMSVPDTLVQKAGRAFKKKDGHKNENADTTIIVAPVDSMGMKPVDTTGRP